MQLMATSTNYYKTNYTSCVFKEYIILDYILPHNHKEDIYKSHHKSALVSSSARPYYGYGQSNLYVSTQSRNGRFTHEIPEKEFNFFLLLLQLLDAQQPDSITTQVCRKISKSGGYHGKEISIYLMPTFVTVQFVCVVASQAKAVF